MKQFLPILILFVFVSCQASTQKTESQKADISHAPEDEAITKAVADTYKIISFKEGAQVNYEHIKNYFVPQAQLLNFRNDTLETMTIDQFVTVYKNLVETNGITSFHEEEIKGTTDQFGRVAQRMSSYKTYINNMDSAAERGVNSFQLIKTPQGWKVSSIIWDVESDKLKMPDYYLNSDPAK
ncbi:hypothetical protein [Paracnuella aquatica]|uniref:hypothetical protein n=1 Tax=Paracnuella aquatica TaxID=2268757 RepID=UPI000DEEEDD8|nr:hypothetical protein [Paracnuella aquatica]RPD43476.1 hypothetical protein DRJ53_19920 [Paracnuella aquatica]